MQLATSACLAGSFSSCTGVVSLLGSLPADGWLAMRMRADMGTATSGHVISFCFSASILRVLACAAGLAHAVLMRPAVSNQRSSAAASRTLFSASSSPALAR